MEEQQAPLAVAATATYAWQLLRLHRPELALELAKQLLARDPADLAAHLVRTEALRQLGRLPEAAVAAQAAVTKSPQSAAAFAAFAQVVGQQGELIRSEKLITEAIRLDPTNAGHYAFLAQLHFLQKRLGEALGTASIGLRINAQHPDCLLWRALAQEAREQPTKADADFKRALRVAPASALLHEWRGRMLLDRHEPHAAGQHLAEALRLAPGNTATLLLLRRAYRRQQWPRWLLHQQQQRLQDMLAERLFDWRGLLVAPFIPFCAVYGWWRTRKQPLFRQEIPGLRQQQLRKWLVLLASVVVLLGLLYAVIAFELLPYSLIILVVAIVRGIMGNTNQRS